MTKKLSAAHLAVGVFLLCASAALGQQDVLAPAPAPVQTPSRPVFWTRQAKAEFSVLAGAIAVDGIATQYGLSQGAHELDPLAGPLANRGAAGQAAASAIGFGVSIGLSYALHRAGHPRAAVIVRRLAIAGESSAAAISFARSY